MQATSVSNPGNDRIYQLTSISDTFIGVTPAPDTALEADTTFSLVRNFSGTYTVAGVADGFIELSTSTFAGEASGAADVDLVTDDPISEWTDWVVLPIKDRTEAWFNIVAPQGMFADNGGRSEITVESEAQIEKLDPGTLAPTGIVETVGSSISGAVQDERAETVERVTAWAGPARVRMRRITPYDYDFQGTIVDEIKWADLYSVSPVTKPDFGNKTTIHTVRQANNRATAVKNPQLSCLASRRLPTYAGGVFSGAFDATGRHVAAPSAPPAGWSTSWPR